MPRVKDTSEIKIAIVHACIVGSWQNSNCNIYPGGMLLVCHLKDIKMNWFKMVQLQFQTQDNN